MDCSFWEVTGAGVAEPVSKEASRQLSMFPCKYAPFSASAIGNGRGPAAAEKATELSPGHQLPYTAMTAGRG